MKVNPIINLDSKISTYINNKETRDKYYENRRKKSEQKQKVSMINETIKENVLINFDMDINENGEGEGEMAIDTYTIIIPTEAIAEEVSLDELDMEFNSCISNVKITENKISMDYFTGETTFIRTVSEIQEHIRIMVNSIRNKLTNIKIGNFKLVCNFYTWRD